MSKLQDGSGVVHRQFTKKMCRILIVSNNFYEILDLEENTADIQIAASIGKLYITASVKKKVTYKSNQNHKYCTDNMASIFEVYSKKPFWEEFRHLEWIAPHGTLPRVAVR